MRDKEHHHADVLVGNALVAQRPRDLAGDMLGRPVAAERNAARQTLIQTNPDPQSALATVEIRTDQTGRRYYAKLSLWLDPAQPLGFWGVMEAGAAQAIKAARKIDQVKVYASGEGSRLDCDLLQQGMFYKYLSYSASVQGHDIMQLVSFLLQSGQKPGTLHLADYTQSVWLDKDSGKGAACYDLKVTRPSGHVRYHGEPQHELRPRRRSITRTHDPAFSPRLFLSELLAKTWIEPAIPLIVMIALIAYFCATAPNYATVDNAQQLLRLFGESGFVALAMAIAIISGGIDLSVGSILLALFKIFELPTPLVIVGRLALGAVAGAANGLLVGYLKARSFLTTLVTLIVLRTAFNLLSQNYSTAFATSSAQSDAWEWLGGGFVLGIPANAAALFVVLVVSHLLLSRSRPGSTSPPSDRAARPRGTRASASSSCCS